MATAKVLGVEIVMAIDEAESMSLVLRRALDELKDLSVEDRANINEVWDAIRETLGV